MFFLSFVTLHETCDNDSRPIFLGIAASADDLFHLWNFLLHAVGRKNVRLVYKELLLGFVGKECKGCDE